jgi:hypothetical protein
MADEGVIEVKEGEELQTKGRNKAFRNAIPFSKWEIVNDAAFWLEVPYRTLRFR